MTSDPFHYDFMKILTGLVPMVQNDQIEYVKAPGKLVGTIETNQEAFPYVYVDIQCVNDNNEVIYAYFSESRMSYCAIITYLVDGEWFEYDSMSSEIEKLEEGPKKLENDALVYLDYCKFGKPEGMLGEVICKD